MDDIIRSTQVCRLAMALDNEPYLVPVSFGYDGTAIYIHTSREGKKIDFFRKNPKVCFEFERNVKLKQNTNRACKWSLSYESVIGYGKIEEMVKPPEKEFGLNRIMLQYSGKEWTFTETLVRDTRVWKIRIDSMTGKRSHEKP